MTREEFKAHVVKALPEGKTAPEPEYKLIEYVYNFHPAISETDPSMISLCSKAPSGANVAALCP